ncbi:MAG: hypothetical protein OXI27_06155 [Thaumarchaeota archaeon]|nr:hypothetical protein [Nitrososphaerota archaeon]
MSKTRVKRVAGPRVNTLNELLSKPNVKYVDLKASQIMNDAGQTVDVWVLIYEEDDGIIRGV